MRKRRICEGTTQEQWQPVSIHALARSATYEEYVRPYKPKLFQSTRSHGARRIWQILTDQHF